MKLALVFLAGFVLASAVAAGIIYAWTAGVRTGTASCPKCASCDEGVEFYGPYSLETRR